VPRDPADFVVPTRDLYPSICLVGHHWKVDDLSAAFEVAVKMVRYAIAVVAIVGVLAVVVVSHFGADLGESVGSSVNAGLSALPTTIGRDAAIALVRGRPDNLGRVDRSDAKLLTLEEYLAIAGPVRSPQGDPRATPVGGSGFLGDPGKRYLWVVAISGEVWPVGRIPVRFGIPFTPPTPTPYPPYRWGLFMFDAVKAGGFGVTAAGSDESWPAVFDRLPNHPAAPYVAPSPTPALTSLAVRLRSPEALSLILRRTTEIRRIDRIEMKLMTWGEYAAGARAVLKPANAPLDGPVWVYAVSGDIVSSFGGASQAPQPVLWAIFAIDAMTSEVTSSGAADGARWPGFFDRLPDHPPAGGP
jgi:hypothetical protein